MKRAALAAALLIAAGCNNDNTITGSAGAAACVTAISCGLYQNLTVSQCTSLVLNFNNSLTAGDYHISPKTVNCVAAAGSNCDAAKRCLNGGTDPSMCTNASASCTGTVLSECQPIGSSGQYTTQFDCGDIAQMCVVINNNAGCGYGTCTGGATMCVGTKWQQCQNGIIKQADCADYSANCVVGALGIAHCRGDSTATCQTTDLSPLGNPLRCDGSVLVSCADSQEAKFDCAAQHQKCLSNVGGQPWGCALGNACNPQGYPATCTGTKLNYCNDGIKATFDCGSVGWHGCTPNNGGQCTS